MGNITFFSSLGRFRRCKKGYPSEIQLNWVPLISLFKTLSLSNFHNSKYRLQLHDRIQVRGRSLKYCRYMPLKHVLILLLHRHPSDLSARLE